MRFWIGADEGQLCQRMLGWLKGQGRTRLAAVALFGSHTWFLEHPVLSRPHWFQTVARANIADVRRLVALLMDYPAEGRPDGLMILDDNLTEHAIGGLLDCGLKIGTDIDVIAHCNWPWPVASSAPIQRVGYHARHVLALGIRAIELTRQHRPLATEMAEVPALFESEIKDAWEATAFDTSKEQTDVRT